MDAEQCSRQNFECKYFHVLCSCDTMYPTSWLRLEHRNNVFHEFFTGCRQQITPNLADVKIWPPAYVSQSNRQKCSKIHKLRFFRLSVYIRSTNTAPLTEIESLWPSSKTGATSTVSSLDPIGPRRRYRAAIKIAPSKAPAAGITYRRCVILACSAWHCSREHFMGSTLPSITA